MRQSIKNILKEETALGVKIKNLLDTKGVQFASTTVGGINNLAKILNLDLDDIKTQEMLVKNFINYAELAGIDILFLEINTNKPDKVRIKIHFDTNIYDSNVDSWVTRNMSDEINNFFPFKSSPYWEPSFAGRGVTIVLDSEQIVKEDDEDDNLQEHIKNILKEETSLQSKLLNLIDTEGLIRTIQKVNGIETLGKILKEKPEILLKKYLGRETFSTDDIRENTGGYNFIFKLVRVMKNEDSEYDFSYSIEEGTVELIMVDNSIHNLLDGASSFDGDTWWEIKYEINDILRDFTKELCKKIKLPFEKTTTGFVLGD